MERNDSSRVRRPTRVRFMPARAIELKNELKNLSADEVVRVPRIEADVPGHPVRRHLYERVSRARHPGHLLPLALVHQGRYPGQARTALCEGRSCTSAATPPPMPGWQHT